MAIKVLLSRAGVKRVLPEMFGGVCGAFLKTLTLTQTKIFDFRYLISELTQNEIMDSTCVIKCENQRKELPTHQF